MKQAGENFGAAETLERCHDEEFQAQNAALWAGSA